MDEREWLSCTEPEKMLSFLRHNPSYRSLSHRRLRLLACACCRLVWNRMLDQLSKDAVGVAEDFAEGLASRDERRAIADKVHKRWGDYTPDEAADAALSRNPHFAASHACSCTERAGCAPVLRDIIANPFRPITLSPAWRTPTILALAQAAYDHRLMPSGQLEPDRLAVLADALEERGCDNAEILSHLRGDGPHVRGCWAVDLVMGRE